MKYYRQLTSDEKNKICDYYINGKSMPIIARKLNIVPSTVFYWLIQNGVQLRSISEAKLLSNNPRRFDESVFDTITEESAYWIGFLMADGCVIYRGKGNSHPSISLVLAIKDKKHLEKFKEFLKSKYKTTAIRCKNTKKIISSRTVIHSRKVAYILRKYGVVPRKSFIAKALNGIESNKHFWRGVIDGDGCIDKRVKKYTRLRLVGSKFLLKQFKHYCIFNIENVLKIDIRPKSSVYELGCNRISSEKIIKHLYEGSNVYLDRKYKKAMEIIEHEK